jgi:glycine/D-amino acid oxidase-like deaminating enzyme
MTPHDPLSEQRRTLWWHTATPQPRTADLPGRLSVDVAVVGGGFTGLTAALHLARRGARVAVLEAFAIGSGASGSNGGFVVPHFSKADPAAVIARLGPERGRRLVELVGQGGTRIFETVEALGIACDAAQTGWLQPAHTDAMGEVLKARAALWQDLGRPVRYLDAHEASALTPVRGYRGALFDPTGGTIQPLSYVHGLAREALRVGAAIYESAPVMRVGRENAHWLLQAAGSRITADKVLLCTNASRIGVAQRLYRTIVPLAVYQMATKPLPPDSVAAIAPGRHPVSDTRANLFTYRLDRSDRLISGGMAALPVGAHGRMAAAIVGRLARELGLGSVPEVEYIWRGTAAMTTDFLPHVYAFGDGFIGGIGCNGRGIAMTAMLGEVLADAACGTSLSDLPIPEAPARPLPFHWLARAAPSLAILQAKWQDWKTKVPPSHP